MPGEEMNEKTVEELAREMEERALDKRIIAALERVPRASVPEDFAARVAVQVPARRSVPVSPSHWGRAVMWVSLAVLLVALVLVSVKGVGQSTMGAALEWSLFVQFLAIAVWLGVRRWRET